MGKKSLYCLILSVLLTSCARIPEPTTYIYTQQPKMQAAYHWDVLANDVANRINNELILNDYMETPVYVKTTCGNEDTPCEPQQTPAFNEAFRDLLITELVQFGVPVQQQINDDSVIVHYKVQVVYHDAFRLRTIKPGTLTNLAAGILVFRNAPHQFRTIATAGLIDILNQNALRGAKHEVVITTSMVTKGQYLFRTSDIYYINDRDSWHYNSTSPHLTNIPLVGPAASSKAGKQATDTGGSALPSETQSPDQFNMNEIPLQSNDEKKEI